ncbi:MAG: helix-turn-helix transcriptional regulator [Bacteroidales bacterium]|nr:helix-turn-helix transcriptional regulator [Bacteroidales bacterium]
MEFIPIPCHESLRPFIRNYWMLSAQCTAAGTQQIFSNGAATTEERVTLLDDFFLKRLAQFPDGDINLERLNDVFDDILPTDGSTAHPPHSLNELSPADLASTACLSQKQFTRVFNKYVGMNPKSYLRLLRFHKALKEIQMTSDSSSLTNIAWSCGYYDLAHMTSDFRDICGFSPSELILHGQELTETFGQKFSGLMKKKIKIDNLI